jgi:ABC-type Mn2+/Zn2+ transport system permease subunit
VAVTIIASLQAVGIALMIAMLITRRRPPSSWCAACTT